MAPASRLRRTSLIGYDAGRYMIEFESFCYLQNQKTGCSFVETFLRKFCSEGIVRYEKHNTPRVRKEGKFYFISVREPLDTYLSLFNYGLDGKGELFQRMRAAGVGHLYAQGMAGFSPWLDFVLNPDHAAQVYPNGCAALARQLGLVSCRFLRLACLGFEKQSGLLSDRAMILDYSDAHGIVDEVIRYESLQQDLSAIVSGPLRHAFADLPAALAWIEAAPRINSSTRRDKQEQIDLPDPLREKLNDREWYLYRIHYTNSNREEKT